MEERGMESGSNMMSACSRPLLDRRLKPQAEQDLKCPRCDSTNTKFCYYNNYSLTQPRHFCKTCRRYWTKGGSLRSVPVGGGCRKNSKRSNNSSSNTSTTKRSGDQPCSTSATSNEGTVTSITSNDLSSPNPNMGGSSNSYAYYNETEDLGINYGRPLGDSGYVNDFGQSGLTGFQSCLPSNLTNLQSLHYSGFLGGDHVFTRPAANRLGTMNVGDLSSIIESKPITSTSFDRDAYVHHNNHHHHNNASVESQSLSHSRLLMQQHHHQHQKSMYEAEAPQGLYEGGGYINGGGMWTDLSPYGLPNVNHTM